MKQKKWYVVLSKNLFDSSYGIYFSYSCSIIKNYDKIILINNLREEFGNTTFHLTRTLEEFPVPIREGGVEPGAQGAVG